MSRGLPILLAVLSALVPWASLPGAAWRMRTGDSTEPAVGLLEILTDPFDAVLVVLWLTAAPTVLAQIAWRYGAGPVWAGFAAVHAGITALALAAPSLMTPLWEQTGQDGMPAPGTVHAIPTPWFIPLALGPVLLGAAALSARGGDSAREITGGSRRAGGAGHLVTTLSGLSALLGLLLPLMTMRSDGGSTPVFLLRAVSDDSPWSLVPNALMLTALTLFVVCAVAAALPPGPLMAAVLTASALPTLFAAGLQLFLIIAGISHRGAEAPVPGPGFLMLLLASIAGLIAAMLQFLASRRHPSPTAPAPDAPETGVRS